MTSHYPGNDLSLHLCGSADFRCSEPLPLLLMNCPLRPWVGERYHESLVLFAVELNIQIEIRSVKESSRGKRYRNFHTLHKERSMLSDYSKPELEYSHPCTSDLTMTHDHLKHS